VQFFTGVQIWNGRQVSANKVYKYKNKIGNQNDKTKQIFDEVIFLTTFRYLDLDTSPKQFLIT